MKNICDSQGNILAENDRVKDFDIDGNVIYGTINRGETYFSKDDLYVRWDDGEECIIVCPELLTKVSNKNSEIKNK